MEDQLEKLVRGCIEKEIHAESRLYNEPQVVIVTPDCYFAIDLFKALEKINFESTEYIVKGHKLFSKAAKPGEQVKTLSKGPGKKETKKLINVYFATPNR